MHNDDSSVFNYFFPENSKAKKTAKMKKTTTTTNKFSVRKAVIKDPLSKVNEEEELYVMNPPILKFEEGDDIPSA